MVWDKGHDAKPLGGLASREHAGHGILSSIVCPSPRVSSCRHCSLKAFSIFLWLTKMPPTHWRTTHTQHAILSFMPLGIFGWSCNQMEGQMWASPMSSRTPTMYFFPISICRLSIMLRSTCMTSRVCLTRKSCTITHLWMQYNTCQCLQSLYFFCACQSFAVLAQEFQNSIV